MCNSKSQPVRELHTPRIAAHPERMILREADEKLT
jgi:hypothetical protein